MRHAPLREAALAAGAKDMIGASEHAGQAAERSGAPYCWPSAPPVAARLRSARRGEHPGDSAQSGIFLSGLAGWCWHVRFAPDRLEHAALAKHVRPGTWRSRVRPCSLRSQQRRERDAHAVQHRRILAPHALSLGGLETRGVQLPVVQNLDLLLSGLAWGGEPPRQGSRTGRPDRSTPAPD